MTYLRPILQSDPARPRDAMTLAGGWCWFDRVEVLQRDGAPQILPVSNFTKSELAALTTARADLLGLSMGTPQVMGIINATPDSFSDGGDHADPAQAVASALAMQAHGITLIDVGGESTRPGAAEVPANEETRRVKAILSGIRAQSGAGLSLDTRKASVARAVADLGGIDPLMINDVSAMRFDADMARTVAEMGAPICLMHSIGTPETMQSRARYNNVVLDVYDHLAARIDMAVRAGIPKENIVVDPGIGFGKTLEHNLALLERISLFHGLGCPVLLGASRKRFIGTIGGAQDPKDRLGGSVSVALHGVSQGVQILRVHDTFATKQAIDLQMAIVGTEIS